MNTVKLKTGADNMELRQIKYFIEVAKREHVTEAANALHVAQSAVSRQIFNLEEELGVDLFIREGRTVRLTKIGRIFLEHMERALHVIEDAKRVVEQYRDPEKGRSEEHTSELQSREKLVCRLLLEKKKRSSSRYVGT